MAQSQRQASAGPAGGLSRWLYCSFWSLGEGGVCAAEGPCCESWAWPGSNLLAWGCCLQVQSAALDEMFHHREDCAQRYHKALLLMEGLLNIITEQGDIENINKCECSVTFVFFLPLERIVFLAAWSRNFSTQHPFFLWVHLGGHRGDLLAFYSSSQPGLLLSQQEDC